MHVMSHMIENKELSNNSMTQSKAKYLVVNHLHNFSFCKISSAVILTPTLEKLDAQNVGGSAAKACMESIATNRYGFSP